MKPKSFDDLYQEAETHDDYWVAGLVQEFTEESVHLMESGGVSRSELARRLGTSLAYVTKILRGNANFTLVTMARFSTALGSELSLQLRPAKASP
ncbi:MAG: helix-turn-helix transcriptional regulator [Deltaproteobacteria bacterium]|nr:helix-turn-helix transcriptional regulator [Deltaproteobacteria bacterium]